MFALDMTFHMNQEQSQKLVMTTQMREALSVLEMSHEELRQYVSDRAEKNVFLEVQPDAVSQNSAHPLSAPSTIPADREANGSKLREVTPSWASSSFTSRGASSGRAATSSTGAGYPLENMLSASWTLIDDIKQQLLFLDAHPALRDAARRLSEDLDENGYLGAYSPELKLRLQLDETEWERAVACIQQCEPAGVGARSLGECLLLQLQRVPVEIRSIVEQMIKHHLEDVANGRLSQIARRLKVTTDDVLTALEAIRRLNPRPGSEYGHFVPHHIRPDLSLVHTESGFVVVVTDASGEVSWQDTHYQRLMRQADFEVRQYLGEQWREARWIRHCLVQRTLTLQRIGEAIITLQPEFLLNGFEYLRPMRLRDIADLMDVHESTVSRAIRHKTMATPIGIVELRQLFTATIHTGGGDVSAASVKHMIKDWIKAEPGDAPLTDAAIAARLTDSGVRVSRRTVAKYREAMGIPGSLSRRTHTSS